jgi:hypothetical protein
MMIKYGLMNIVDVEFCLFLDESKEKVEDYYAETLSKHNTPYKVVAIYIDEEPPTTVVKDDLSDRQVMFLADDGGDPKLFDHMAQAVERIDKEGDLYQHIGRMECVFKPIVGCTVQPSEEEE